MKYRGDRDSLSRDRRLSVGNHHYRKAREGTHIHRARKDFKVQRGAIHETGKSRPWIQHALVLTRERDSPVKKPAFQKVQKEDDIVNWLEKDFRGLNIGPEILDQGKEASCQYYAMASGGTMGYKRSRALEGESSNFKINPNGFVADGKVKLGIPAEKLLEPADAPPTEYLFDMLERDGVLATCSEWPGEQRKLILGSSCANRPKQKDVTDLIDRAIPLLIEFPCCKYFGRLKEDEVYKAPRLRQELVERPATNHMVLVCGYGLTEDDNLFLIFANSWGTSFCKNGFGRILFDSMFMIHTLEIHWRIQPNIIAEGERTVNVKCWGFFRKVEQMIVSSCGYMKNHVKTDSAGVSIVTLQKEVTPLALALILGHLRHVHGNQDTTSFDKAFVRDLDTDTLYDVMRAADSLELKSLASASARVMIRRTEGWSSVEFYECLPHMRKEEGDFGLRMNKIVRLSKSFQG